MTFGGGCNVEGETRTIYLKASFPQASISLFQYPLYIRYDNDMTRNANDRMVLARKF